MCTSTRQLTSNGELRIMPAARKPVAHGIAEAATRSPRCREVANASAVSVMWIPHMVLSTRVNVSLSLRGRGMWAGADDIGQILRFFITAITILAVVVPEGLPLAVTHTLSLIINAKNGQREQSSLNMDSSETMGGERYVL